MKNPNNQKKQKKLKRFLVRQHFDACVSYEIEAESMMQAEMIANESTGDIEDQDILDSIQCGHFDIEEIRE